MMEYGPLNKAPMPHLDFFARYDAIFLAKAYNSLMARQLKRQGKVVPLEYSGWTETQVQHTSPYFFRAFKWFCGKNDQSAVMMAILEMEPVRRGMGIRECVPVKFRQPINECIKFKKIVITHLLEVAASWKRWDVGEKFVARDALEISFWNFLAKMGPVIPEKFQEHGFNWPTMEEIHRTHKNYININPRDEMWKMFGRRSVGGYCFSFRPEGGFKDEHIYQHPGVGARKTRGKYHFKDKKMFEYTTDDFRTKRDWKELLKRQKEERATLKKKDKDIGTGNAGA